MLARISQIRNNNQTSSTGRRSNVMFKTPRSRAKCAALCGVAALFGASAALVAPSRAAPHAVSATNHCTRYAPVLSQDVNCNLSGTMYSTGTYGTPATALRDQNSISLAASRKWTIAYYGGNSSSATGTGTSGSIYSSAGFAYADCWLWSGQSSVSGHCTTLWHD
jgi:hypothetical protein